jgi:hypothetical protein
MPFETTFSALLAGRLGARWGHAPYVAHLDDRLRRDVGLPPAPRQPLSLLAFGLR